MISWMTNWNGFFRMLMTLGSMTELGCLKPGLCSGGLCKVTTGQRVSIDDCPFVQDSQSRVFTRWLTYFTPRQS